MDEHLTRRWPGRLFILSAAALFFGSVYYLALASTDPDYYWGIASPTAPRTTDPLPEPGDRIVLSKDRQTRIGNATFIYRGRDRHHVRFEVVIPDLDPFYAYRHEISVDRFGRPLRLAGLDLEPISANGSRLRFRLMAP